MEEICRQRIADQNRVVQAIAAAEAAVEEMIAVRVEGTLREFPRFKPVNIWFQYPLHYMDETGLLGDLHLEDEKPMWQKGLESRKTPEQKKESESAKLANAFSLLLPEGKNTITVQDLMTYFGWKDARAVIKLLKRHKEDGYYFTSQTPEGKVGRD